MLRLVSSGREWGLLCRCCERGLSLQWLLLVLSTGSRFLLLQYLQHEGLIAPQYGGSSRTRDWTCVFCIGRWIPYHWATRKALFFSKDFFFRCGSFLKSLLNLLQYCFCFMFWCFGHKLCEILLSTLTRDWTPTPCLGRRSLPTTGLPGKSQVSEISREHFKIWGLL